MRLSAATAPARHGPARPSYLPKVGTRMNCSLSCDDVETTYRQLGERGVEFEGPPKKQAWGSFVIMKDSEGNRFVLGSD
ncbi:MAG: VOC family protein [Rhizomicrobium sp.]